MKKRTVLSYLLLALVLAILLSVGLAPVRGVFRSVPWRLLTSWALAEEPIPDLATLLEYPYQVHIEDMTGAEKEQTVDALMARPEAVQLTLALEEKGFLPDLSIAEAMSVTVSGSGEPRIIELVVVPMKPWEVFLPLILKNDSGAAGYPAPVEASGNAPLPSSPVGLVAYLVGMVADDGTTFFQAHHTNLDPRLAEVPDPAITVNSMPYFYVTTLQVVSGRIVYWRYWWYDSHRHPNWYYACYRHYWDYYDQGDYSWPGWYHWAYGWYYWRFWYYWSTWFPW